MSKESEIKLLTIKKGNIELYEKVVNKEISIQDAFNEIRRVQLGLSEFRGKATKKKEFSTDFKRMMSLHDSSQEISGNTTPINGFYK